MTTTSRAVCANRISMNGEMHRFLSSLIACGGSSFRKGLPSATRAQDKARQTAKRQGFVSYDDLHGWSITGRGRDAIEAKDHPHD